MESKAETDPFFASWKSAERSGIVYARHHRSVDASDAAGFHDADRLFQRTGMIEFEIDNSPAALIKARRTPVRGDVHFEI